MKRKLSAILAALLAVGTLVGCGNVTDDTTTAASFHEPIPAAQAGKTFVGWYADEALTKPFDFTKIIVSNNNVLIYAKWE